MSDKQSLRDAIGDLAQKFQNEIQPPPLRPGVDYLPPSGKVVGHSEFLNLLHAAADMWLTAGRFCQEFETKFPTLWGLRYSLLTNSGSSANLLAVAALTSPKLKEKALRPGDEVVTAACGFPTTVAPSLQYGLVPVFVDVDLATQNALPAAIEAAITPKTKLVMLAHTLGNPYRADQIAALCQQKGIWLVEDCCDALGATVQGKHVGTFGNVATCSFYPAHHITMGEGGALLTNQSMVYKLAMSFRDWGRDCWCEPGISNTCGSRFGWKLGDLPEGYDHKYTYSHLGFNLKTTDFQAALGLAQLERMNGFVEARRRNHEYLTRCLRESGVAEHFVLPEATPGTEPSWFGYLLTLKETGRRKSVVKFLEENKVGTRLLFGGNLTKQPALSGQKFRVSGELTQTDKLMNDAFWVGIWPGLNEPHLEYITEQLGRAVRTS